MGGQVKVNCGAWLKREGTGLQALLEMILLPIIKQCHAHDPSVESFCILSFLRRRAPKRRAAGAECRIWGLEPGAGGNSTASHHFHCHWCLLLECNASHLDPASFYPPHMIVFERKWVTLPIDPVYECNILNQLDCLLIDTTEFGFSFESLQPETFKPWPLGWQSRY